jgi:hypothetical protein
MDDASKPLRSERPTVVLRPQEDAVVTETIRALRGAENLFQRDGNLVRVMTTESMPSARRSRSTRIEKVPSAAVREAVVKHVNFERINERGEQVPSHPPHWLVSELEARGTWEGIPRLVAVVHEPMLRPDGSVLDEPGYDAATGVLYVPGGSRIGRIENATRDDARYAAESLLEIVVDFPFVDDAHRSACLAGILTPFARFAFHGPAPLFLIDANTPGTGKTLLADLIGVITTGRRMPRLPHVQSDDEMRKRITSIARDGTRLALIDNVAGVFGCPALDAALTSTLWRDRLLGVNDMSPELDLLAVWYATGNNIILNDDTYRRVLHILLETDKEKPEERGDFKHPDLLRWVEDKREAFARNALTILHAYHAAGRPVIQLTPYGSYEEWSRCVRAAIVWCGCVDPVASRAGLSTAADHERNLIFRALCVIEELDRNKHGLSTGELLGLLRRPENEQRRTTIAEWFGRTDADGLPPAQRFGMKLSHLRKRIVRGKVLRKLGERWSVDDGGASDATGTSSGSSASPPDKENR